MRLIYMAVILVLVVSCNNGGPGKEAKTAQGDSTGKPAASAEPVRSKLTDEGTQVLMQVVNKYYALKNALVATKAADAGSAAADLDAITDKLNKIIQRDSANGAALKLFADTIAVQSKQIASLKDESCEKQRLAFGAISSAMYGLLKAVELKHVAIYHEYCPMAFNEKGAFWLSDEPDIKNPYFGKKMLECGEVTDSLK